MRAQTRRRIISCGDRREHVSDVAAVRLHRQVVDFRHVESVGEIERDTVAHVDCSSQPLLRALLFRSTELGAAVVGRSILITLVV